MTPVSCSIVLAAYYNCDCRAIHTFLYPIFRRPSVQTLQKKGLVQDQTNTPSRINAQTLKKDVPQTTQRRNPSGARNQAEIAVFHSRIQRQTLPPRGV